MMNIPTWLLRSSLLVSAFAVNLGYAKKTCYQISATKNFPRTLELLCVDKSKFPCTITLENDKVGRTSTIATFRLSLLKRSRGADTNDEEYGVETKNSTFNQLKIIFSGKIDRNTKEESGKVKIGKTEFYYRDEP